MLTNLRISKLGLMCVGAFLAVSGVVEIASAQLIGDRELLKQVAAGYRANKERIKTWQGTATVTSILDETNEPYRITASHVEFVQDISNNKLRWSWKPFQMDSILGSDGTTREERCGMVWDDLFFSVAIGEPDTKRQPLTAVIHRQKELRPSWFANDFNPMFYFTLRESDPADTLMWNHDHAAEPGSSDSKTQVLKKDNLVILEITAGNVVNRYTFDMAQGCNMVQYYGQDSEITEEWKFEFRNQDGVFLPAKVVYENRWKMRDGKKRLTGRTVTMDQNVLNKPIDPSEFSPDKLGLQAGESYYDNRDQKWHTYRPASEPSEKDSQIK